jgi:hypothetical protein
MKPIDETKFQEMVKTFLDAHEDGVLILATLCGATGTTVKRWASGKSSPLPHTRSLMAQDIENYSQEVVSA